MNKPVYEKFGASLVVEGSYPTTARLTTPASLLELALQYALLSMPEGEVAELVRATTSRMLHSLSCKRRQAGDFVRLSDEDPDGHNGLYQVAAGRGEPQECMVCGNRLCIEWPTLREFTPEGVPTGEYAYHISECQMHDCHDGLTVTGSGEAKRFTLVGASHVLTFDEPPSPANPLNRSPKL